MSELPIKIGANSAQLMLRPSGLIGPDGIIKSNLALKDGPITILCPAEMFPFLSPDHPALVILSVTQIKPAEPIIEEVKPRLITPGDLN